MRKLLVSLLLLCLVIHLGCASAPGTPGSATLPPPLNLSHLQLTPQQVALVNIARPVIRGSIEFELSSAYKIPIPTSAAVFNEIDPQIDMILAGQNPVLDISTAGRAALAAKLSSILQKDLVSKGVPLIDKAGADALATEGVNLFVSAIQGALAGRAMQPVSPASVIAPATVPATST